MTLSPNSTASTTSRSGAKLLGALKKLNTQPIQAIEEVNMFKSDGNVIHFAAPKGMSLALLGRARVAMT